MKTRTLFNTVSPYRIAVEYGDPGISMARQEFMEECDVNRIMKRFEENGELPVNRREPMFFDAASVPENLQEAMNGMIAAEAAFLTLPASVRKEFDNDAVRFVGFAQDRANLGKLREWGLAPPEAAPPSPVRVEVVSPAEPPSTPPNAAAKPA